MASRGNGEQFRAMKLPPGVHFEDPLIVLEQSREQMGALSQVELFASAGSRNQKLKEAWCAGAFGIGYGRFISPCRVAVNDSDLRVDADFFLESRGGYFPFQLVECQEPGRRRGDEYRGFANGAISSIPYEPERGRIEGPTWIADKIGEKVAKTYAGAAALHLLVYANFPARQLERDAVVAAAGKFEGHFASVWIVTSSHVCTIFGSDSLGCISGWGALVDLPLVSLVDLQG